MARFGWLAGRDVSDGLAERSRWWFSATNTDSWELVRH